MPAADGSFIRDSTPNHPNSLQMMQVRFALPVLAAALGACVSSPPQTSQGLNLIHPAPGAVFKDRISAVEASKANFCVLIAVDGKSVPNSIGATLEASRGKGNQLFVRVLDRAIDVGVHQLTLRCQTVHAAPIMALLKSTYFVEGSVEVDVKNQGLYVVNGELGPGGSSVWLEDETSGNVLPAKITSTSK